MVGPGKDAGRLARARAKGEIPPAHPLSLWHSNPLERTGPTGILGGVERQQTLPGSLMGLACPGHAETTALVSTAWLMYPRGNRQAYGALKGITAPVYRKFKALAVVPNLAGSSSKLFDNLRTSTRPWTCPIAHADTFCVCCAARL